MTTGQVSEVGTMVRRIQQGDEVARRDLFALLAGEKPPACVVLAMARRFLPRHHRARRLVESQDIVQSALRTAWNRIEDFRGASEGAFYGWFGAILRTEVNRVARRDARIDRASPPTSALLHSLDPATLLAARELRENVRAAIGKLGERQRIVVQLRLRGLSTAEICRALRLKQATVRQREKRAVDSLRRILKSHRLGACGPVEP